MSNAEGNWTDDDFISGLLRRDECVIAAFISDLGPMLERVLLRSNLRASLRNDVEDVVSITTVLLLKKIGEFDRTKGAFRNWISKLAYNVGADLIRNRDGRSGLRLNLLGDQDVELSSGRASNTARNGFDELSENERGEISALREEVELLPPKQRAIIEADFASPNEKASAKVLGQMLNTSENAIYALRCVARNKLREGMIGRGFYQPTAKYEAINNIPASTDNSKGLAIDVEF